VGRRQNVAVTYYACQSPRQGLLSVVTEQHLDESNRLPQSVLGHLAASAARFEPFVDLDATVSGGS